MSCSVDGGVLWRGAARLRCEWGRRVRTSRVSGVFQVTDSALAFVGCIHRVEVAWRPLGRGLE